MIGECTLFGSAVAVKATAGSLSWGGAAMAPDAEVVMGTAAGAGPFAEVAAAVADELATGATD